MSSKTQTTPKLFLASFQAQYLGARKRHTRKLCTDMEQPTYYLNYKFHRSMFALRRMNDFFGVQTNTHTFHSKPIFIKNDKKWWKQRASMCVYIDHDKHHLHRGTEWRNSVKSLSSSQFFAVDGHINTHIERYRLTSCILRREIVFEERPQHRNFFNISLISVI